MADEDEVGGEEEETKSVEKKFEEVVLKEVEKPLDPPKYEIRPRLGEKFQAGNVREIIMSTMREQLFGRSYRADQVQRWCKMIANGVRYRVEELNMKRYKIIVTTTIIEMKGAGVKSAQRCIWDPECDDYTDDLYRNETIFCYTACYGIYMY